jgi:hypothetical protein
LLATLLGTIWNNKVNENAATQAGPSTAEIRAIVKEAYIYGFPVVTSYSEAGISIRIR